jgi:hypothetical protein
VTSNDGARVTIGDRVVYEDWTDHATKTETVPVTLANPSGVPLVGPPIVVEYFYNGGSGVMRLEWTPPGGARRIAPVEGLRAEYFRGVVLADPWFAREEPAIDHDFGSSGPRREPAPVAPDAAALRITLPAGTWRPRWVDPVSGEERADAPVAHGGGVAAFTLPAWRDDLALELRRVTP